MKYQVNLPFAVINFKNAQKKHISYFKTLLFDGDFDYPESKYVINVNFIRISFKNTIKRYLEEDSIASNSKLYLTDTKGNKVELDFASFTKTKINLKVEPDFDLYFLYNYILEPLIIIWAAEHKITYVHSSALYLNGEANIFAAWRHTGKTSSIFSLVKEKVKFMADDFCVLFGNKAYIYPKSINIFSYNFESYPWLYDTLPKNVAMRIKLSVHIKKLLYWMSQKFKGSLAKVFYRLSELAEVSTNTKVTPEQLGLDIRSCGPFKKVVFITKSYVEKNKGKKLSKHKVGQKMLSITKYETDDIFAIYQKYKYLYPGKNCPIIENFDSNYLKSIDINIKYAIEKTIKRLPSKDAYLNKVD